MHALSCLQPTIHVPAFTFSPKNERKLLKVVALGYLHQIFREVFQHSLLDDQDHLAMESYSMDSKIIQLLIKGIIETEEYTLEGIAFYTRVPFDVIYDAAFGSTNKLSVTPWVKVVELYLESETGCVASVSGEIVGD